MEVWNKFIHPRNATCYLFFSSLTCYLFFSSLVLTRVAFQFLSFAYFRLVFVFIMYGCALISGSWTGSWRLPFLPMVWWSSKYRTHFFSRWKRTWWISQALFELSWSRWDCKLWLGRERWTKFWASKQDDVWVCQDWQPSTWTNFQFCTFWPIRDWRRTSVMERRTWWYFKYENLNKFFKSTSCCEGASPQPSHAGGRFIGSYNGESIPCFSENIHAGWNSSSTDRVLETQFCCWRYTNGRYLLLYFFVGVAVQY